MTNSVDIQPNEIDWGSIEPSGEASRSITVKNTGNTPITLEFTTTDFEPLTSEEYLSLSWNYTGAIIQLDETIDVMFTLTVNQHVQGFTEFSFNIEVFAYTSFSLFYNMKGVEI